jgi:hypothetical protein
MFTSDLNYIILIMTRGYIMWKVIIIESERNWGQKVDKVRQFEDYYAAKQFYLETNAKNNLEKTPDIYWYAQTPVYIE